MATDHYAATKQIIEALASEGLATESRALQDMIESGSTGNEILMGVRWQLEQIDKANRTTNLGTKRMMRTLIADLNRFFSP